MGEGFMQPVQRWIVQLRLKLEEERGCLDGVLCHLLGFAYGMICVPMHLRQKCQLSPEARREIHLNRARHLAAQLGAAAGAGISRQAASDRSCR